MPSYFDIVQASAEPFTINPPAITGAPSVYYENNILFGIDNAYPESDTEIYRSLSSSGGFELIAVVPGSEIAYYDADLSPRTTYYYKLRANWSGVVSEYSGVASYITGSKYYPPYLTSAALSSTAVALTLTDRSYDDLYYEIIRTSGPGTWSRNITAADSGQVITVIDSTVSPGTTYQYRVDVYTKGPGNPNYPGAATPHLYFLTRRLLNFFAAHL
jgi:hypothetical protein